MTALAQDWREFTLGELLRFSNGINADKSAYGAGVPFVNVLEVITHESIVEADVPGRIAIAPKLRRRYEVKSGDVLFNRTSETPDEVGLASVYLGTEPIVFGGFVFRGQPLTDELSPLYSKYAFRSPIVRNQIVARGQGGIRANIGQRDLKSVAVCLPSRPEQSAIAGALDDVSALIATMERQITKKQSIKYGMMQQLLSGGSRLPGFTAKWGEVSLGDTGTISGGGVDKTSNPGEQSVRLLNYLDVYRAEFITSSTATQVVTAPSVKLTKCAVRAGDVFFTPTSETPDDIARSAVATCDLPRVVYSYHLVRWRPSDEWDPSYLAYAFATEKFRRQASVLAAGSGTRYVISMPAFRSLVALRPPVDEQRAIGSVLREASTEIESLRSRLAKARAIKTGMMQELLTGRTRLPVMEVAA